MQTKENVCRRLFVFRDLRRQVFIRFPYIKGIILRRNLKFRYCVVLCLFCFVCLRPVSYVPTVAKSRDCQFLIVPLVFC